LQAHKTECIEKAHTMPIIAKGVHAGKLAVHFHQLA
jgi:hypothetical protein